MCGQTPQQMVREFHEVTGADELPYARWLKLRKKLLREEHREVRKALNGESLTDMAKELADLAYVVYGSAVRHYIDLDVAFAEVHKSNMSKLVDGKPIKRPDGKILKGPNYRPPDLWFAAHGAYYAS